MPQTPHDRSRRRARRPLREVAACLAAGVVLAPLLIASPALALGEDGPFDLPLAAAEIAVSPTATTRVEISALIEDSAESELDLSTAQLAIPADLSADDAARMQLSEDGTSLVVLDEGTWSIAGGEIVFVPDAGFTGTATSIALTVGSIHGTRSLPAELAVSSPEPVVQRVSASAGQVVTVHLQEQDPSLSADQAMLQLDGLPAGSTVTDDGLRVVVPEQGTWQLSEDRLTLTFTPLSPRLGRQPTPVRYAAEDASGEAAGAGVVSVITPVIPDMKRSAQFGEPIVFTLAEGQQNIDPDTLALVLVEDDGAATLSADGTSAQVPGQGRWELDRDRATVTFTPSSADVTVTAPMGVTGGDGSGSTASQALLDTSYPRMADLEVAGVDGSDVVFQPSQASRDIRADSLVFDAAQAPEGAVLSDDGLTMTVAGQGTWSIDLDAQKVTFAPATSEPGLVVTPVTIRAGSLYADNTTTATLTVQYAAAVPTMRDDEVRTAPSSAVTTDVLANDTPAGVGQPLQQATLRLRSMDAVNLDELENWTGTRLVIPDEGTFTIGSDGVLTFVPVEGFVGTGTSIDYLVTDSTGVVSEASIAVEVDPEAATSTDSPQDTAGINSLLAGLMPENPSTAVVFGAVFALTIFAGGAMLWIGSRMELDRRTWRD